MAIKWKKIAFAEDVVSNTAYGASWDGVTDVAPSKNAVYDGLAPKVHPIFSASLPSEATLGDNLVTNGDFATNDLTGWTAAAGWSAATGKAVHSAGIADTTPLVQAIGLTNALMYMVEVTTSGRTAGSVTLTFGALVGSYAISTNTTTKKSFTATSTANFNLTITPTADFDGAIDNVKVQLITANTTPIIDIKDSVPTSIIPIRASAALLSIGIGFNALSNNVYGEQNTAIGYQALLKNTVGCYSVAIGSKTLYSNTVGFGVAIGYMALFSNTLGTNNVAIGSSSLYLNTTGIQNTAIGAQALYTNTTGNSNIAIGSNALLSNQTGSYNIAVGGSSLYSVTADNNVGVGYTALYSTSTGNYNTAIGNNSLYANKSGYGNTAIGFRAGYYYGTGSGQNKTSFNSIYLGYQTRASASGAENECVIGYNNAGNGSNTITLGNASVTGWYMGATKLIGQQGAAVADATDGTDVITQLNALLARLRAHGLIAT